MKRPAVLVLDMIADFTTGPMGSEGARKIRPAVRRLLRSARAAKVPVLYGQEAHTPSDPELKLWGPHGMARTPGARTDPMLQPKPAEPVVPKHTYDAFHGTDLDDRLRALGVDAVVLAGVCTEICVQHTAAGAFFRGYRVVVARDGTSALVPEEHERALGFMKKMYGARVTTTADLIRVWSGRKGRRR